jgi:hypothetical protein
MMKREIAIALGLLAAAAAPARAQDFPADADWDPFHCGDAAMFDAVADEPTAIDERDIVGDEAQPAGLHYSDADFAYLRMRVEEDPTDGSGDLQPFAWGFEFDTDGDLGTYEVLVIASGVDQTITVYTNDSVTIDNSPADPADADPVAVYDWAANGRAVAAGSSFGGDGDTYLDMAVLWDDLETAGMTPISPVVTWAGTSSTDNALDGDLACHDAGTGDPTLDGTSSDEEPIDTGGGAADGGPTGTGDTDLEGGGGCAMAPHAAMPFFGLVLFVGLLLTAKTRRARRRRSLREQSVFPSPLRRKRKTS